MMMMMTDKDADLFACRVVLMELIRSKASDTIILEYQRRVLVREEALD